MTFRRDKKLFYEVEVGNILLSILSFLLIPFVWWMGILGVAHVVFAFLSPRLFNQYITINDCGITCKEGEKQLWAFEWSQIMELKKYSLYRNSGILLVLDEDAEKQLQDGSTASFQLCKEARMALNQYCAELWRANTRNTGT